MSTRLACRSSSLTTRANRDYLTERGAWAGGTLVLFRSDDNGRNWSKPIEIKGPDWGHHAIGPGIGIQLRHGQHKGRLPFPANFRRSFDKRQPSYSHVIFSHDRGKTWKLGGTLGDYANECQLAEVIEEGRPAAHRYAQPLGPRRIPCKVRQTAGGTQF